MQVDKVARDESSIESVIATARSQQLTIGIGNSTTSKVDTSKAEPSKAESNKAESSKADTKKADTKKADPSKAESSRSREAAIARKSISRLAVDTPAAEKKKEEEERVFPVDCQSKSAGPAHFVQDINVTCASTRSLRLGQPELVTPPTASVPRDYDDDVTTLADDDLYKLIHLSNGLVNLKRISHDRSKVNVSPEADRPPPAPSTKVLPVKTNMEVRVADCIHYSLYILLCILT